MIDRYRGYLADRGIAEERFEVIGWTQHANEHLNLYNRIDIALDPFPYNGTTTSCEALWMGVPIITLTGNYHCSRVGTSLLASAGLEFLIAGNRESYVDIATNLANDSSKLSELRKELRATVSHSPICDAAGLTREIEDCYRKMWGHWCSNHGKYL